MAPALTKILKDGHGIHLSSPASDGRVMELDPTDDLNLQKMLLNLPAFPSLDSYLHLNPLDLPSNTEVSSDLQPCASQCELPVLPRPGSLLMICNKGLRDSHQVASMFPGVPDMFLVPVPEHNSQEACLLRGHTAAFQCEPDGGDVHQSLPTLSAISVPYAQGDLKSSSFFAPSSMSIQETPAPMHMLECDQLVPSAVLEGKLSRQAGLQNRAWTLQRRLQILLGEHALLHCTQQLQGLKRHCCNGGVLFDSIPAGVPLSQVGNKHHYPWLENLPSFTELEKFAQSSHAVLGRLQEALDSEATASSSSDEELEDFKTRETKASTICERRWLEERAELGSRWSWLQLRLAELDGRIQQLGELHKHLRSTKGGVVLAESQPMTDRQIQQTLLKEMAWLSCTPLDADSEPCSPTRLLHNIERQSAQLSEIVNSLMLPLNFSPLSKQPDTWKGKRGFNRGHTEVEDVGLGSSKRRKFGARRQQLLKAAASCVCARTRPLVTYHKPKLFRFNACRAKSSERSTSIHSSLISSPSSSSCSRCFSCNPVAPCSNLDCSSSRTLPSRTPSSTPHHVVFPLSVIPQCSHFNKVPARETWSQIPLVINTQPLRSGHYSRYSPTPLHNSHKYKQHARPHENRVLGPSPIRLLGSAQSQHRKAYQRKRKRRRIHRLMGDDDDVSYCDPEDSSDEVLEESYTPASKKQASQGSVRRRQGQNMFNINNVVIPMSLTKVEKLQYKDILTPSWRVVDTQFLVRTEAEIDEDKDEQVEIVTDEVFAQRHLALEQKEKRRWPFWGKRKGCRHPTRSGSRLSGSGGGMCTSGEESSVEWSCAQLDPDEQPSSEECLPQAPWEPRVFPLNDDEEQLLLSEEKTPDRISTSSSSKNFNFHLSTPQSSGATPPSGGQTNGS
ncbi:KAT8 regulatory NSL complex subunit 1-like protein isoform X2 [Sphaeramia orbicularis]|uniref:PEHE domain-containing protein n=1 Tax=Sphaeramia orbicularis TaxID=375764 RepID=A0A673BBK9_9TELE|nr:KAT8 regulatory NSL complex subunit 1-like protein isoform X2 [Sphaeramia orbicularis]